MRRWGPQAGSQAPRTVRASRPPFPPCTSLAPLRHCHLFKTSEMLLIIYHQVRAVRRRLLLYWASVPPPVRSPSCSNNGEAPGLVCLTRYEKGIGEMVSQTFRFSETHFKTKREKIARWRAARQAQELERSPVVVAVEAVGFAGRLPEAGQHRHPQAPRTTRPLRVIMQGDGPQEVRRRCLPTSPPPVPLRRATLLSPLRRSPRRWNA